MKLEAQEIVGKQNNLLRAMPAEVIAHGTDIREDVVSMYLPDGGLLLDLGCGDGRKGSEYGNYGYMGIDINPNAIAHAKKSGFVAFEGDVRNFFGSDLGMAALSLVENISGVLCQGLLANMVADDDIRSVFQTADIALRPGGFLFIAEPIRWDQCTLESTAVNVVSAGYTYAEWQRMWTARYDRNERVGLPRGVFAVAKPGLDKHALEWSEDQAVLENLIAGPLLERFARHVALGYVDATLKSMDFTPYYTFNPIMQSRLGEPLFGFVVVYKKEYGLHQGLEPAARYKYHPWYKNHSEAERLTMQDWRQQYEHDLGVDGSVEEFMRRLRANMPMGQQPSINFPH